MIDGKEVRPMRRSACATWLFSTLSIFWLAGCGSDPAAPVADSDEAPPWPENLETDDHLVEGLFGWPETPFSRGNSATIEIFRHTGNAAVDFTLRNMDGDPVRLADLLRTRPVLLVPGSYT